jgi:hypothetical protein
MTRKLKALGLALVAVFAMSAIASASASAEVLFHSESTTTFLTGEQIATNTLDVEGGNVKCSTVKFTASTSSKTVNNITVTPTYSGCTAFGLVAVVDMESCDYLLTSADDIIHVVCPGSNRIKVTVTPPPEGSLTCTVEVGPQTLSTTYTNEGGPSTTRDIKVTPFSFAEVDYNVVYPGSGTKCGKAGFHENGGTYTGSITVKGYSNSGHTVQTGIWKE